MPDVNEVRYYLQFMRGAMTPQPEIPEDELAPGAENLKPFTPTYLVTAVKLPTGAIELAINNENILEKINYILDAYDDDMRLKTNPAIEMVQLMVV